MSKILSFILLVGISVVVTSCDYYNDARKTTFEETKLSTLLKKYEWFKDAVAQLDKKIADISVYESRLTELEETYQGVARKDWPRTDLEQSNLWRTEVAGIKASYNSLAAQYNSNMAKINYRFTNVGMLPEGATEELPREFRTYTTK